MDFIDEHIAKCSAYLRIHRDRTPYEKEAVLRYIKANKEGAGFDHVPPDDIPFVIEDFDVWYQMDKEGK